MGAGIAKEFAKRMPQLPDIWGTLVSCGRNTTMATELDETFGKYNDYLNWVVYLPTKNH